MMLRHRRGWEDETKPATVHHAALRGEQCLDLVFYCFVEENNSNGENGRKYAERLSTRD